MAHPWHHAVSSARRFGGAPSDFLRVHEWFDQSKAVTAHVKHRALRHHLEGVGRCVAVHAPQTGTCRLGDDTNVTVEAIGRQHLAEDFTGFVPRLVDWAAHMDVAALPLVAHRAEHRLQAPSAYADRLDTRLGTHDAAIFQPLVEQMFCGLDPDDPRTWLVSLHAEGIFQAEWLLGPLLAAQIPVRIAAEALVKTICGGTIPSANDWLAALQVVPWMNRARKLSLELGTSGAPEHIPG